jgi:glycine cleavage system H lipoate-binding protein
VESVKSVNELFTPVSGQVLAVNEALVDLAGARETVHRTATAGMMKIQFASQAEVDALLNSTE